MSTQAREPMWYCHECHSEMRPLMIPDPHCASCQGSFVEKLDNPSDDPRHLDDEEPDTNEALNPFSLIASFNDLLRGSAAENRLAANRDRSPSPIHRREIRLEFGLPNNRRQFIVGGPNVLNRRESESNENGPIAGSTGSNPPRLSDFLRANGEASGASEPHDMNIPGQLMAQYLMALLGGAPFGGSRGTSPFFSPAGLDEHGTGSGRWGDYVFTQEALDQLMTQLMEGANSTRPVPAPEDVVERLPREVLDEESPLLEKDCAVCKEQFSAKAEEPDEQVVVTLPCSHPFHEGCILPWLKSSGTCPVCRYALVPQPNSHPPSSGSSSDRRPGSSSPPPPSSPPPNGGGGSPGDSAPDNIASSSSSNANPGSNIPSNNRTASAPGGFFSNLFSSHRRNGGGNSSSSTSLRDRRRRGSGGHGHIPGSWGDTLD